MAVIPSHPFTSEACLRGAARRGGLHCPSAAGVCKGGHVKPRSMVSLNLASYPTRICQLSSQALTSVTVAEPCSTRGRGRRESKSLQGPTQPPGISGYTDNKATAAHSRSLLPLCATCHASRSSTFGCYARLHENESL